MRSSWGSITREGPGRYRLRYVADMGDGRGRVRHSETVRGSRKEARRVLSEREAQHGLDRPTMTLSQCAERWWIPELDQRVAGGDVSEATRKSYLSAWRAHVRPRWGDVAVTGIRPLDVQEWLPTMGRTPAKVSLIVMRSILRLAVLYDVCDRNVAEADYRMPKRKEREYLGTTWALADCEAMARAVRGTILEVPVILSAFGSCRVGEACGVRAEDCKVVGANGMRVMCCHVVGEMTPDGWEARTKNPQSVRWVVVPEPWSLRLAELMADGREWLNDDGCGRPVPRHRVRSAWLAAFREGGALAGFGRGEMRGLRASWRTFMRDELHIDRDVLEKMMGHGGRGVGEVHYYRPDEETFADVVSRAYNELRAGRA